MAGLQMPQPVTPRIHRSCGRSGPPATGEWTAGNRREVVAIVSPAMSVPRLQVLEDFAAADKAEATLEPYCGRELGNVVLASLKRIFLTEASREARGTYGGAALRSR